MIYNENLKNAYGSFGEIGGITNISKYRPTPNGEDYRTGYISRFFAKKANENVILEIDYNTISSVNTSLYKVVKVDWKISGPKNNVIKNGVIDKTGVMDQNKFEIDRVYKEEDIDLSGVLSNLLEYWKGG